MDKRNKKRPQNAKKPNSKQAPNPTEILKTLELAELTEHPSVKRRINHAIRTGRWGQLENFIKTQFRQISKKIITNQKKLQLAQIDPYHPRPTDPDFLGNIPIAYVPDPYNQIVQALFFLRIRDFINRMFICGSAGGGKTRCIISLIASLKQNLHHNITIWIFEPKKSFRYFLHEHFKILEFTDFSENLFKPPTEKMLDFSWRNSVIDLLSREQQFHIGSKNKLRKTLRLIAERTRNRYPDNLTILNQLEKDVKKAKFSREANPLESLINRFDTLAEFDDHSRNVHIPIEELTTTDLVIEWGEDTIENDKFRTAKLLWSLYHLKKHERQSDLGQHFNLIIIDEGRELFKNEISGFGESILEMMFALSREMNIGFIVASQEPRSVSKVIKANTYTTIAFPISDGDQRKSIAASMGLSKPQYESFQTISTLGPSHAIAKYSGYPTPFPVMFPHIPDPDLTLTDATIKAQTLKYLEKYKIPNPITPKAPPEPPPPLISKDEKLMMRTIHDNPLLCVTEIYKKCRYKSPTTGNEIKSGLLKKGYIEEDQFKIKKNSGATKFMRLTTPANSKLGYKAKAHNRPGIKHENYCRLVRLKLEDEGWDCEFKGQTKDHPHKMDVLAIKGKTRHDYEITTSRKNIRDNINQALGYKLAEKVIIIADDKEITKCRKKTGELIDRYNDALEFRPISDFYIG